MIFFYSRKLQCILLTCWLLGMGYIFFQIIDASPRLLAHQTTKAIGQPKPAEVLLGQVPEITAEAVVPAEAPPKPEPKPAPTPAADPHLNRFLALRTDLASEDGVDVLVLELDYVPAQQKGFTAEKTQTYYLSDAPTFVLSLGGSWVSDIGNVTLPGSMEQMTGMNLIVSRSNHLRLLVHTRSMAIAREARAEITSTETGLRATIHLPK